MNIEMLKEANKLIDVAIASDDIYEVNEILDKVNEILDALIEENNEHRD
jgi:hypothetical protein